MLPSESFLVVSPYNTRDLAASRPDFDSSYVPPSTLEMMTTNIPVDDSKVDKVLPPQFPPPCLDTLHQSPCNRDVPPELG